jgi:hypothetical protein
MSHAEVEGKMSSRTLLTSYARVARIAALALATTALGCGGEDTGENADDVTDIANSSVKNQSIGNCWVYASVGWVESLRLTHAGEELDLSESYITYWHWFEQIHGGGDGQRQLATMDSKDGKQVLSTGGWWGTAVELMNRYGMLDEGVFIPEEAELPRSTRQKTAQTAIDLSLKEGVLSNADNRRKPDVVRAELDKAWALQPAVIALLDEVFGKDVSQTLYEASVEIPGDSGLRRVNSLEVGHDGNGKKLTLADAIGKPSYTSWGPPTRSGTYAWNEKSYPSTQTSRRAFQIEVQKALHNRLPAIMTWFVDFAALGSDNAFRAPPAAPGRQGGHMTVIEDYQINDVPGHGTLQAGVLVTDPEVLEAALSPEAKLEFFRIKNSWGTSLSPDPNQGDALKGYHDLYLNYLDARLTKTEGGAANGLTGVVLPPATFFSGGGTDVDEEPVGTCAHDICVSGSKLDAACDPCVAKIAAADPFCVENSWDDVCIEQVASVCSKTCP